MEGHPFDSRIRLKLLRRIKITKRLLRPDLNKRNLQKHPQYPFIPNIPFTIILLITRHISLLRFFVVLMTVIAVLLIPLMASSNGGEIFRYSTTVTGYLAAPTCAMFFLAIFWKRVSEAVYNIYAFVCVCVCVCVCFVRSYSMDLPVCGSLNELLSMISNI